MIPNFKFALTDEVYAMVDYFNADNLENIRAGKVKALNPMMFMPTRSNDTDVGWDVRCASFTNKSIKDDITHYNLVIEPTEAVMIKLGLKAFIPDGWWLKLVPRSSTFHKKHLHALYGVVDEGYEGQIGFCVQYMPNDFKFVNDVVVESSQFTQTDVEVNTQIKNECLYIPFGERIAQLIPVPRYEMNCEHVQMDEYDKLCQERGDKEEAVDSGQAKDKHMDLLFILPNSGFCFDECYNLSWGKEYRDLYYVEANWSEACAIINESNKINKYEQKLLSFDKPTDYQIFSFLISKDGKDLIQMGNRWAYGRLALNNYHWNYLINPLKIKSLKELIELDVSKLEFKNDFEYL